MIRAFVIIFLTIAFCASALAEPMNNTAAPIFERTIFIGVPASKVWTGLTDPTIVNQYYLAPLSKIELKPGGEISYGTSESQMITGKIEELETGRKLGHTFQFSHNPNEPPTYVLYSIDPMGDMCALRLRHDRFPSANQTFADISEGWDTILSSLKTLLETGHPLPWPKQQKAR